MTASAAVLFDLFARAPVTGHHVSWRVGVELATLVGYGFTARYLTVRRSDEPAVSRAVTWLLAPGAVLWSYTVLRPVAPDFAHEMNGPWLPWGAGGSQGAEPDQFTAAWRRIRDLFAAAGDRRVIWVWVPNVVNPVPDVPLADWWPGSAYVDWVGIQRVLDRSAARRGQLVHFVRTDGTAGRGVHLRPDRDHRS